MITLLPEQDFELIKKALDDRMTEALMNKSDDIEGFKQTAELRTRLQAARSLYINDGERIDG